MVNHTVKEINGAIKEFEGNPYRYENVSIESADIAIDCMRSCILDKRKVKRAADVQPAKRGKWLQHGKADDYFWCCSACKKWIIYAEHDLYKHHYCGNCGAKMDGDDSAKG